MIGAKERDVARESNGERNGLADRGLPVDKLDEGRRWLSARPPSSNRATRSGGRALAGFYAGECGYPGPAASIARCRNRSFPYVRMTTGRYGWVV